MPKHPPRTTGMAGGYTRKRQMPGMEGDITYSPAKGRGVEKSKTNTTQKKKDNTQSRISVAPVAYQVILEPGIGQFREFGPRRVHTRINSLGLFLVHKLTCGKRESVS